MSVKMTQLVHAVALGAAGLFGVGVSQATRSLSIVEIAGVPFPSQLSASPAGNVVAWVFNERGARNVWIYPSGASGGKARRLTPYTEDDGNDLIDLVWNGDGRSLFYTRGGAAGGHSAVNPLSLPVGPKS